MKPVFCFLHRGALIAWLLAFGASMVPAPGQGVTSPALTLTFDEAAQTATASWFGDSGVPYQLETSGDLSAWTDAGGPQTGSGSPISVTLSTASRQRFFVRFKYVPDTITAAFNPATGVLTINGGPQANTITVGRSAVGTLLVNGGTVSVTGGIPTTANTTVITIFGKSGGDELTLDESNGPLPPANLFGEEGDDTLTGGSNNDELVGGSGRDLLLGGRGADRLFGGDDNDTLIGGDGDDQAFGEGGDDRIVWNPGDDTDLDEGGSGSDTVEINGGNGAEVFTATANVARVRFDRLDPAPFALDIGTCENLVLNANGGNDTFSATGNLAALIQLTVDGGADNDTLLGGNGADVLLGGDGDDFIDGQQGNDTVLMGAGDDVFQWDPGDGSDTVEGEAGQDRLVFNGSAGSEIFDTTANGSRVRFTRNLGTIVMDLNDVEETKVNVLGGTDTLTVNDLTGTHLRLVTANLAGTLGGTTGDGAADAVIVNGTGAADTVTLTGAGTTAAVTGLFATVAIENSEGANDRLHINGLAGADTLQASNLAAGVTGLSLNGGTGNDTLQGSAGNDQLDGGGDQDVLDGNQGTDLVLLGAGDDTFQWDPGDGSDTIEGQAGTDTLVFNGSNAAESMNMTANGSRLLFFRDVGAVTLDCDDVENVQIRTLGGADALVIGDLAGTDASGLLLNLAATGGGGDGSADSVTVNGTNGDDILIVSGTTAQSVLTGLSAAVTVTGFEAANDSLTINALGGADIINATSQPAGAMRMTLNGGLGDDVLFGSQGGDTLSGGDGNDAAFGAEGDDTLVWNPGDDNDVFEGQAGTDRLVFNASNAAELVTLSAHGSPLQSRVLLTRDIASVTMDLNEVETIDINFLGGADRLTVNPLATTSLRTINAGLAGTIGGASGDGQADIVTYNGTTNPDTIAVAAVAGAVEVTHLTTLLRIRNPEIALDSLVVNGLGGADSISVGPGVATLIAVTINQRG
jgi:Ca2+-binding RTX toxin-like protein